MAVAAKALSNMKLPAPETYNIKAAKCGSLAVLVQGTRQKNETCILTVHDVGTNSEEFLQFTAHPSMSAIAPRVVWIHVTMPGQEEHGQDLDSHARENGHSTFRYPTMQELADAIPQVLEQLNVNNVVLFGYGAGANVLLRTCMTGLPNVLGAVLINCNAQSAGFLETQREKAVGRRLSRSSLSQSTESRLAHHHFGAKADSGDDHYRQAYASYCEYLRTKLNPRNLSHYVDCYFERNNLLPQLGRVSCPMLLIAGARSEYAHTVHSVNAAVQRAFKNDNERRRQIEFLRVDGSISPMHEKPEKLAECLQFFLQGLGLLSSLPLPLSQMTVDKLERVAAAAAAASEFEAQSKRATRGRSMSMADYDKPRGPCDRKYTISGGGSFDE